MIPHTGTPAMPEYVRRFCTTADEAGLDGLWEVDHMVMPHHTDSPYVLGRNPAKIEDDAVSALLSPNYEMMTTLCWVAGFTSRIKLGTAVAVLPIRNAVVNARQLSTLDVYSGGRVLYGVGVGWLREEAEAMGMPWDRRGRRGEEHIALLRALWCVEGDLVEFHGEFHDLPPMDPDPVRCSGRSRSSWAATPMSRLERAGCIGDGWIVASMSAAPLAEHWAKVRGRRSATVAIPTRCSSSPRCGRYANRARSTRSACTWTSASTT